MIESILQNLLERLTPGDMLAVIAIGAAFAEALLHWLDNHYAGKVPPGVMGVVVAVARITKRYLTPGGIGREAAKKTNPASASARHDDGPTAGDIAKRNGSYNGI